MINNINKTFKKNVGKTPPQKTQHNNMAMRKERQFLFNGVMSKCKMIIMI